MAEKFVESKMGGGSSSTNQYEESSYTDSSYSDSYNTNSGSLAAPPQVPYPWRARWSERERRYVFVHQETGEEVYEYQEVIRRTRGGGYEETQTSSYYDQQQSSNYGCGYSGGYGGGYGNERVYESEQVQENKGSGGGHGMMYGALGAAAGLAAGAGLMYEGEKIRTPSLPRIPDPSTPFLC